MTSSSSSSSANELLLGTPSEREIRVERVFNAPIERVWSCFTDPELLSQWWCRGNPCTVEKFELDRGGHWRLVEHSDEGIFGFEGRFREIRPQQLIEMTFEWDEMPGHASVERSVLEDLNGQQTRLVAISLFFTQEDRDRMLGQGCEEGMRQSYAALDRLLASLA